MIRGKYLRERKVIRYKRRIKLLVCLLIIFILHKVIFSSYSLYESKANSNLDVDAAFFVLKNEKLEHLVTLNELKPGGNTSCSFSIANFLMEDYVDENGQTKSRQVIAETDIKYKLTIRTTTNLPLKYELYINDNPIAHPTAREQINGGNELYQDEHNTYFNRLIKYENTFEHDRPRTDTYILKIYFPEGKTPEGKEYTYYTYQNIIDAIEISIDAEQIID